MYIKSYMRDYTKVNHCSKDFERLLYRCIYSFAGLLGILLGCYLISVNAFAGVLVILMNIPIFLFGMIYFRKINRN